MKKFFGENEDFHKEKVAELKRNNTELAEKLQESEARRMEKLLEEADTSKASVRHVQTLLVIFYFRPSASYDTVGILRNTVSIKWSGQCG